MTEGKPNVSIIIPTFNERENISHILHTIIASLRNVTYEILVIDDQSGDGTAHEVQQCARKYPQIHMLTHHGSRSLGRSILLGIKRSSGDTIIGMDADGNHDPKVIPSLLSALEHADLAVGSRYIPGGGMENFWRYWASYCFNIYLRIRYGFPIWDNTSGCYAIRKENLKKLKPDEIFSGYGEYHLRLVYIAKNRGLRIMEVPVYYKNRQYGQSKTRFFTMTRVYLSTARSLYKRFS
jgi:dolichol-phosphate mannosyltransferase